MPTSPPRQMLPVSADFHAIVSSFSQHNSCDTPDASYNSSAQNAGTLPVQCLIRAYIGSPPRFSILLDRVIDLD